MYQSRLKVNRIFDRYTGAAAGYSLFRLSGTYTGNCIEVRRSSDDTTQNIGFIGNFLDVPALKAFVGAGNGFVRTLYSQIGSYNLVQATNANQPQIMASGQVLTYYGLPTITFTAASNQYLEATGVANTVGHVSLFNVVSNWKAGSCGIVSNRTTSIDHYLMFIATGPTMNARYRSATPTTGTTPLYRHVILTGIFNGSQNTFWINGTQQTLTAGQANLTYASGGFLRMGVEEPGSSVGTFYFNTSIIYFSDQTSNRTGIEAMLQSQINQYVNFANKTYLLPDSSGTEAGKGFTITGIYIDQEETIARNDGRLVVWCGNHGLNQDGGGGTQEASVVKLLMPYLDGTDMSSATKLDEILVYANGSFTGTTVQGICIDNSGYIWFVSLNSIYKFHKDGTYQLKYTFTAANGLAYDRVNDQLIVSTGTGVVSFVNPATGATIGGTIQFLSSGVSVGVDQISYDSTNQILYGSRGANGSVGLVIALSRAGAELSITPNVTYNRSYAAEGIAVYDKFLLFASDAWYHMSEPDNGYNQINNISVYRFL